MQDFMLRKVNRFGEILVFPDFCYIIAPIFEKTKNLQRKRF